MATSEPRARLAIAIVLLLSGCSFSAGYDGTRYRCDDSFRCPDGQLCVDGSCELLAAIDGGDGEGDGDAPVEVCAEGQLIVRDDFDVLDPDVWIEWANGDADVFASGGSLVVSSAVDSNGGVIAVEKVDLARLMVSVELGMRSSGGQGTLVGLQLMDADSGDGVMTIERTHDDLRAAVWPVGAELEELDRIDFDAQAHRFLRIVTTDDAASFESSPDEIEWSVLSTRSIADLPGRVAPQVQSGSYGAVGQDQALDLLTACQLP